MTKLLIFCIATVFTTACNNAVKEAGAIELLSSPADSVSGEPYLYTDKAGGVYLSWIAKGKDTSHLKFAGLNASGWTNPSVISSGPNWFVNWADYPVIAKNNGSMMAHFLEKSETGKYTYDIKLTTSADDGKTWSQPALLNEDGKKAEHGFVSIVPYGENYFVAWLDGRNAAAEEHGGHTGGHQGQMSLRGAVLNSSGKKTAEWELDNRVCDCCQTTAAITANGPVVIYRDRSDAEIRDMSIVRMINGKWTEPKNIFPDDWKIEGCPVNGPRVDALGNNIAVAWFSSPDKKGQVKLMFSVDGGANFGAPIRLDEGQGIGRVDVLLLDDKTAMVSWMEGSAIKAVKVHSDGKKDPAVMIASSSEARSSGFPQMTKSGNTVYFAWTDDKAKKINVARMSL